MPLDTFEKYLPWSGAVAGLCWVGHDLFQRTSTRDEPGAATAEVVRAHLVTNYASVACLVLMGVSLLFFAAVVRNLLRSREPQEATYSSIAYGGWLVTVAGISQMVVWDWGLINGAADAGDDTALQALSYVHYFSWAGMGIGLATAFIAMGWGGLRCAALPRWFSVLTIGLGLLGALGNAGIPPGGLVTYLLLPIWLLAASFVVGKRLRGDTERPGPQPGSSAPAMHSSNSGTGGPR